MKKSCWQRIIVLNEHFGLTMSELEKRAGLSRNTLPRKEPENYNPRVDTIDKICKVYGMPFTFFYMEEYDFKEIDFVVLKRRISKMVAQLSASEAEMLSNIIEEKDYNKYLEKCYAVIQKYDTTNKYPRFEDFVDSINARIKANKDSI